MLEITWKIEQLERRTSDGYVIVAHWRCTGIDGNYVASIYNSCGFTGPLTTPYEDLTEEQVLGWVWDSGVDKTATETAIAANIEQQKNPPVAGGVPWSSNASPQL